MRPQSGKRPPSGYSRELASNKYFSGPNDFHKMQFPRQDPQTPQIDEEKKRKLKVQASNPLLRPPSQKEPRTFAVEEDELEQSVNSSRYEILSMLSKREKDKEEIDLDNTFS